MISAVLFFEYFANNALFCQVSHLILKKLVCLTALHHHYIIISMKIKKNIPFFVILCASLLLLSILFSYRPLGTELQMTPEWTIDITKSPGTQKEGESLLPFHLGHYMGYFTHSGKITTCTTFPYKVTMSKDFYSMYKSNATDNRIFDSTGKEICTLKGSGFPYIQDDRLFLFMPGGSGFKFYDETGKVRAVYEHTAPVTAFNSSKTASIAGFADGTLRTFDSFGNLTMSLTPGGSDYPVILGAAISKSGQQFACITGQEKQRFVLYKTEGSHAKIVFHEFFNKDLIRQTFVHFNSLENMVYYNYCGGIGIVDCTDYTSTHIPLEGKVIDIQESPVSNSIFILSRNKNNYTVTILESFNSKVGSFSFKAEAAFIIADGNTLYIGRDNKISRITLSRE